MPEPGGTVDPAGRKFGRTWLDDTLLMRRLVEAIKNAPGVPVPDGTAIIVTDEVRDALREADKYTPLHGSQRAEIMPEPGGTVENIQHAVTELLRRREYALRADTDEEQAYRNVAEAQTDLLVAIASYLIAEQTGRHA